MNAITFVSILIAGAGAWAYTGKLSAYFLVAGSLYAIISFIDIKFK